jgi:hypothetical protein
MQLARLACISFVVAVAFACGGQSRYIAGSEVEATPDNQRILETLEAYRIALEARDASKLLMMASDKYWDDGGTPSGEDDYGYSQLKEILATRLQRASDIRYSLRYKAIRRSGDRVFVDVLIDASFTVTDADGKPARRDMRDRNQFVLEFDGEDWKFISGM